MNGVNYINGDILFRNVSRDVHGVIVLLVATFILATGGAVAGDTWGMQTSCVACHAGFVPVTILLEAPVEVPEEFAFDAEVTLINDGGHDVQDLILELELSDSPTLVASEVHREPYHDDVSGEVTPVSDEMTTFPVAQGSDSVELLLSGGGGVDDMDLLLSSPDGRSWSSSTSGDGEGITLEAAEVAAGGYGTWTARVSHVFGRPRIPFDLSIDVTYAREDAPHITAPDLSTGESFSDGWEITSLEKGDNSVTVLVSGSVYHAHADPDIESSSAFTVEVSSDILVGDRFIEGNAGDGAGGSSITSTVPGRIIGLLTYILLILAFTTNSRINITRPLVPYHGILSRAAVGLAVLHWTLLYLGPYAETSTGLFSGLIGLTLFGVLAFTGQFMDGVDGPNRRIHLVLSMTLVALMTAHMLLLGTDFAFIR